MHSEIVFCIEPWRVHITTSETMSPDNRLEWMSLDEEEFQNKKEIQKIWGMLIEIGELSKKTSYSQSLSLPDVILTFFYSSLTRLSDLIKINKIEDS